MGSILMIAIIVTDGDPNAEIAASTSAGFFFVVELASTASLPSFKVAFDPDEWDPSMLNRTWGGNKMENVDVDKALSIEKSGRLLSNDITINAIPEFSALIVPIIGAMAIALALNSMKKRKIRDKSR